jgi:hypothetical protein
MAKFRETAGTELRAPIIDDGTIEQLSRAGEKKHHLRSAELQGLGSDAIVFDLVCFVLWVTISAGDRNWMTGPSD